MSGDISRTRDRAKTVLARASGASRRIERSLDKAELYASVEPKARTAHAAVKAAHASVVDAAHTAYLGLNKLELALPGAEARMDDLLGLIDQAEKIAVENERRARRLAHS